MFGHEKLDVYKVAIQYIAFVFSFTDRLSGKYRHAKEQWIRASQSIPLNIAEGNGKSGVADRKRYFEIARGPSLECAAIQDVLEVSQAIHEKDNHKGKIMLDRIVAMLTKMK